MAAASDAATYLVGTSGYNYPEWKGAFYPPDLAASKMLPYYAEHFPTVEINYTFYRLPNSKTVHGWSAATPAGFSFALKASQRITHSPVTRSGLATASPFGVRTAS